MAVFTHRKEAWPWGAKFAPSIVNLFMGEWEDKTIFSVVGDQLLLYRRYIPVDDLFFHLSRINIISPNFLDKLNTNTHNIRLTSENNQHDIHFLDVNIYRWVDKLDKLGTKCTLNRQFSSHSEWTPYYMAKKYTQGTNNEGKAELL